MPHYFEPVGFLQDRALLALIAILVSMVWGLVAGLSSRSQLITPPLIALGTFLIGGVLKKADNEKRSVRSRSARGVVLYVILLGPTMAALYMYNSDIVGMAYLFCSLSTTAPWVFISQLKKDKNPIDKVIALSSMTRLSIDPKNESQIAREGASYLAQSYLLFFAIPVLAFIMGGALLLNVYVISILMIHARAQALLLKSGVNTVPASIAAIYITIFKPLAIIPCVIATRLTPKLSSAKTADNKAISDSAESFTANIANQYGIALGGKTKNIYGEDISRQWLGDSSAKSHISPQKIKSIALYFAISSLLLTLFVVPILLI